MKTSEIFWTLVKMDAVLRYQNSVLGLVWVFLKPFLLFGILALVFSFWGGQVEHFTLYLLLGLILFQFFSEGTTFGISGVLNRAALVQKIQFPRALLILAAVFGAALQLFLATIIFFGFLVFSGIWPSFVGIIAFLAVIFILFLLILGVSFLGSILMVYFRDLAPIWEVVLAIVFYATPVFYPFSILPPKVQAILGQNPLVPLLDSARAGLIYHQKVDWISLGILAILAALFCAGAAWFFHRKIQSAAERI